MPKVKFDGIQFDSELEVNYYKYLRMENLYFRYHPKVPIKITSKNEYTPDFVVYYPDRHVEVIETKGYNPYSKMRDDMIHQVMLGKSGTELMAWLEANGYSTKGVERVEYRKIKFIKAYGFVDWDFKNPNTIANKRKEKINEQQDEIKALKDFKKNAERYFTYYVKLKNMGKLTKPQREWYINFEKELMKEYGK